MNIRNQKELCRFAEERLKNAPASRKIALIYAAIVIGLSALTALASYALGLAIDRSGGLSGMGTRTILSAVQNMLPLVQTVIVMCIDLGFTAAILRIARGQYVSPQTLRLGFDRFGVLLRYSILETVLFFGVSISSIYLGVSIFLLTPMASEVTELLVPLLSDTTILSSGVTIPDGIYESVMRSMLPAYLICGGLFCLVAIPLFYRLRMSRYVLIEKPGTGALFAMRSSRKMMRKNCLQLFKLDLRLWWFYLASFGAFLLGYGDMLLPMIGVNLPFHEDVNYFLFYGLYWAAQFAIFSFLLPKAAVPYALAYDALCPKEDPPAGVVLGNIFQM